MPPRVEDPVRARPRVRCAAAMPWAAAGALAAAAAAGLAQTPGPSFTQAQADAGRAVYASSCGVCHGADLQGGAGPALAGATFQKDFLGGSRTLAELYEISARTMPQNAPGSLGNDQYLQVTAYLLSRNGFAAGAQPLTSANMGLRLVQAAGARSAPAEAAPDGIAFPPPPHRDPPRRPPNQTFPIAPEKVDAPTTAAPSEAEIARIADADWLTYNRDYAGARYSPLAQITPANAASLAPRCIFQPGEPGSFQNSVLVYKGTLYLTTNHRIFALDAATCAVKWGYTYTPQEHEGFPSGRGLALYEGRLFKGTSDGHLLALDAATGKLLWEAVVDNPELGYCVSGAPAAFGGKVVVGECGGDNGVKGHIHAFDAASGKPLWTFDAIPTGNQPGAETWGGGTEHGGGPSWSAITVDPERKLFLAPIGNPGPDFNGEHRPGANLYTNAVVALEADTGRLAWYVQPVSHDTHDWDQAAAPALYDRGGRRLMAVVTKSGYLMIYDRDTRALVAKSPTQSRYENTDTPLSQAQPVTYCPGAHGQWNGAAYSPGAGMLFTGSEERCETVQLTEPHYIAGRGYYSGRVLTNQAEKGIGWIRGYDALTGKQVWSYRSASPINGAVTATAGGVLLTGDTAGWFLVMDQRTGRVLYRFQTGGPIAGGASSYAVDGEQYVAVASGNTSRDASASYGAATVVVFGLPPRGRAKAAAGPAR